VAPASQRVAEVYEDVLRFDTGSASSRHLHLGGE
jgi:hypothetical protein